ncbi:A/G-specific adenine glycosylase [Oceanobacillus piezotolerans]|uniref:Adenine DNA glycosylase n=1 Tax=Oceanobacillus piezotolerans TaxID=2448030 RepID=A0A498D203_9BACI|nr:A/G-specific adenine glycosylase [Oceanobacillus piezotolerans]RLL40342.1 A/G-specific adenine glycosylase [Oceanobacillus piezotolerans]
MVKQVLKSFNILQFQEDLLQWYYANKRDLPWRKSQDPYRVWVSEIMLQQTKVDTVIPYYYRFMEKFPTVYDLAEADEQDVLKAWEGLGYYSRARNLQSAVREVVATYDGKVPDTPEELGELKGVGPYTKGAILSIAYNQPEPAVDGNVMRVFSRVLKIEDDIAQAKTRKLMEEYVREVISKEDPSSFNQAIMDLGATICTPKSPGCMLCPIAEHCKAYEEGIQEQLPVKKKAKKQKLMEYVVLLIKNDKEEYLIEKRPSNGLLADLWQFPMIPIAKVNQITDFVFQNYGVHLELMVSKGKLTHVFSHIKWDLEIRAAEAKMGTVTKESARFVKKYELKDYPFPVSHQKMMKYID